MLANDLLLDASRKTSGSPRCVGLAHPKLKQCPDVADFVAKLF
jgi:hypothetical protein